MKQLVILSLLIINVYVYSDDFFNVPPDPDLIIKMSLQLKIAYNYYVNYNVIHKDIGASERNYKKLSSDNFSFDIDYGIKLSIIKNINVFLSLNYNKIFYESATNYYNLSHSSYFNSEGINSNKVTLSQAWFSFNLLEGVIFFIFGKYKNPMLQKLWDNNINPNGLTINLNFNTFLS